MQSERNTIPAAGKIDYQAVRENKARMLQRFMTAKSKAEKSGALIVKPL